MRIHKALSGGFHAMIICRRDAKDRLATRCFRGKNVNLAGNFKEFGCIEDIFMYQTKVLYDFMEHLELMAKSATFGTQSFTVSHSPNYPVGWSSTDYIGEYDPGVLKWFKPNRKSDALRIKPSRIGILAPLTSHVTIVYEYKLEHNQPTAIIHSLYPGVDIGELKGNITDRESCVFFDWDHPGMDPKSLLHNGRAVSAA